MEMYKSITLEDELFEKARNSFNTVMQRMLKNMIQSQSEDGSITMKVEVHMTAESMQDFSQGAKNAYRDVRTPQFKHKISSQVTVKDEASGDSAPGLELVWDEDLQMFVLKPITGGAQRSMFDPDFQAQCESAEPKAIGMNPPQIECRDSEDVGENDPDENAVDGEFSDVDPAENDPGTENPTRQEAQEGLERDEDEEDIIDDEYGYDEPYDAD